MANEMLDILIGRYIDSEITPAEQRLLNEMLQKDASAQKRVAELTQLRDTTRRCLNVELDKIALTPATAFENAWNRKHRVASVPRYLRSVMRIAAVLAVGFLIGTSFRYLPKSADPVPSASTDAQPPVTAAMPASSLQIVEDDFPLVRDASAAPLENSRIVRRWITPEAAANSPYRYIEWQGYPAMPHQAAPRDDLRTVDYNGIPK